MNGHTTRQAGFSLLEVMLAMAIVAVIAIFAVSLSNSIREGNKVQESERRMQEVIAKVKVIYRNTQETAYDSANPNRVPAQSPASPGPTDVFLNMDPKYVFDSWGQTFDYYARDAAGATDIDYYTVDGKTAAGAIISKGPDQQQDYTVAAGTITTVGDDMVLPIDVSQEAVEIALDELKILQDKVKALDNVYAGVDNNGNGTYDENGCTAVDASASNCPPTNPTGGVEDPNCAVATLDAIENGADYNGACPSTGSGALAAVRQIYALSDQLAADPWGRAYKWGCDYNVYSTAACQTAESVQINSSLRWYHKFYSLGVNPTLDSDDLIP